MEEHNENIENKHLEAKDNETTNIPPQKTISKKAIIIVSIVATIAILATIICIITFGKSSEEKAIIGEWRCFDEDNYSLVFKDNNTGSLYLFGKQFDFRWKYDNELSRYAIVIDNGATTYFEIKTDKDGLQYIHMSGKFYKQNSPEKCQHQYRYATCIYPKLCLKCGTTVGNVAEHSWTDATCTTPKTCSVCNATEGDVLGHTWTDATCTTPKTCSVCNATEGDVLEHTWTDATCAYPQTCSLCSETRGAANGHTYIDNVCSVCNTERTITPNSTTEKVLNYLKEMQSLNIYVTSADVAEALGLNKITVDNIFTSAIQRTGLGVRVPDEIVLEDGTHKQVKWLRLTPEGMVY